MNSFRFSGNFEDAACNYDRYADVQRRCAEKLVALLLPSGIEVHSFIDIGAGTGFATLELLKIFPKAKATLLDVSPRMLDVARSKVPASIPVLANAEIFDFSGCGFDLAVANLSAQWFHDFAKFLQRLVAGCRYFLFSIPLRGSFAEYTSAFAENGVELPALGYYEETELVDTLRDTWNIRAFQRVVFKKSFSNLISAARHFKNIGANFVDATERGGFAQSKISAILRTEQAPITLTYDVLLCFVEFRENGGADECIHNRNGYGYRQNCRLSLDMPQQFGEVLEADTNWRRF